MQSVDCAKKTAVYIALPAFGQMVTTHTMASVIATINALGKRGIGTAFGAVTYPNIAELRNMLLTVWYDTLPHATHMLFVDADMSFKPDLVLAMLDLDAPLVGTLYRKKKPDVEWVGTALPESVDVRDGFIKVAGVGGGVLLIRRDCIDTMIEKIPSEVISPYPLDRHNAKEVLKVHGVTRLLRPFDEIDTPTGRISEDLSFCDRWLRCGGDVWASIIHETGHIGLHEFRGAYAQAVSAGKAQAA